MGSSLKERGKQKSACGDKFTREDVRHSVSIRRKRSLFVRHDRMNECHLFFFFRIVGEGVRSRLRGAGRKQLLEEPGSDSLGTRRQDRHSLPKFIYVLLRFPRPCLSAVE